MPTVAEAWVGVRFSGEGGCGFFTVPGDAQIETRLQSRERPLLARFESGSELDEDTFKGAVSNAGRVGGGDANLEAEEEEFSLVERRNSRELGVGTGGTLPLEGDAGERASDSEARIDSNPPCPMILSKIFEE
jgi:hypothetical protein